ncbi:hypothetical protein [Alteraurantiacibacter aquimixticola]|uniref:Uncharacterized protein n=1 Tax=Alteraurantiacibacter aquimixticola TaxID=2489173 RepID=A0A4T3F279_9SPHN|nr:hypothetical protein [Alteraurantiacibacter aquimixticola]TIX50687.1 hypothetical protein E5222_10580 [Alteraurantiacibacter aquimixticola]
MTSAIEVPGDPRGSNSSSSPCLSASIAAIGQGQRFGQAGGAIEANCRHFDEQAAIIRIGTRAFGQPKSTG